MPSLHALAAVVAAAGHGLFAFLLLTTWRRTPLQAPLLLATFAESAWLLALAAPPPSLAPGLLDLLRTAALLLVPIRSLCGRETPPPPWLQRGLWVALLIALGLGIANVAAAVDPAGAAWLRRLQPPARIVLAVFGLTLLEQLQRNTTPARRRATTPLVVGLATLFGHDLYLHAEALLAGRFTFDAWFTQPFFHALALPFLAVAARRALDVPAGLPVSRSVAFHATVLSLAGAYLLFMAVIGYGVPAFGRTTLGSLRFLLLGAALVACLAVSLSDRWRQRVAGFVAQHFYPHRHDWQAAWWSFTGQLAHAPPSASAVLQIVLEGMASRLDCAGGSAWCQAPNGAFLPIAASEPVGFAATDPFIERCRHHDGPFDLAAEALITEAAASGLPRDILARPAAWLLVPIRHGETLLGLVLLSGRAAGRPASREDRLLVRTMARQAAAQLALLDATAALAEARQFAAFHQLSAFVMHDLKNVAAQLSLIVANARTHLDTPGFAASAIDGVAAAEQRLVRLLGALRETPATATDTLPLAELAREAVQRVAHRQPVPALAMADDVPEALPLPARLADVLEHLLQNAQDATPPNGSVRLSVHHVGEALCVEILDTGRGMTREFLENRLFHPFQTTKGQAGMGIGVYQSLRIVRALGGAIRVESTPGKGTVFRLDMPWPAGKVST